MADISKVKNPDGNTYNVKDSTARDHIANKNNPHSVTKTQIGLGNVDNTSDAEKHVLANNINWGGPVINDGVSPIDAGISSIHGANRLSFCNPNGITIEYSNDGGTTWSDYGASDGGKVELVTSGGHNSSWFYIGKRSTKGTVTINDKLRVTFNAYKCGVYTAGVRLLLNLATNGASGSNVVLEISPHGDATTFSKVGTYPVSGWSGWNSIPINFRFGGQGSDAFRLTFGITGLSSNSNYDNILQVGAIFLYGTSAWTIPSNMAYNNHLYSFDYAQNAFFPAQVTATKFNGTATSADKATKATQDASGNVITSTYATKNELTSHSQNVSNPHKVTASQVGALPLSGGTLTGKLSAPSIETGEAETSYFQTKKMRGEGNADTYYHAIDFGYPGHDQVDFYEYGGKYIFHQHTDATKDKNDTVIGEINDNGFVGKVNGYTINANVPAGAKFTDTTYSNATTSAPGLMSSADKTKLDGIAAGAEFIDAIKACPPAISHRMIYRGKNLGTSFTTEQSKAVQNGTFTDIYVGDYWVINGKTRRIGDIDYFYGCGDTSLDQHHLLIVDDGVDLAGDGSTTHFMNDTDTTAGGFKGSKMWQSTIPNKILPDITTAFGSHLLTHREYISNAVTDGVPSNGEWVDTTYNLFNEIMYYGSVVNGANIGGAGIFNIGCSKNQIALFKLDQSSMNRRNSIWLRDVVSDTAFALAYSFGYATGGFTSFPWFSVLGYYLIH